MRILHLTKAYPAYVRYFYSRFPELAAQPYGVQRAAWNHDSFAGADFWVEALRALGHETECITAEVNPQQRVWGHEFLGARASGMSNDELVVEQAKRFAPEILWFDDWSLSLLRRLRESLPSLRLVLGWTGSAFPPDTTAYRHIDLMLSCAPEAVERLRAEGLPAEHLDHGFDPRVNDRLRDGAKQYALSFFGQIIRGSQFHNERAQLLEALGSGVTIFSDLHSVGALEPFKTGIKQSLYGAYQVGRGLGLAPVMDRIPVLRNQGRRSGPPISQANPTLRPYLRPAVYGLSMYQAIRDSHASLNIHADSSPRFASNMRLFETTGAGTCLLTDWRENMPELFRVDEEVVCYRNAEECLEKARWLRDNPRNAFEIGEAGRRRTLQDHTYLVRAKRLDKIIRGRL